MKNDSIILEIVVTGDHTYKELTELVNSKGFKKTEENTIACNDGWMKHEPENNRISYGFKSLGAAKRSTRQIWNDVNKYVVVYEITGSNVEVYVAEAITFV